MDAPEKALDSLAQDPASTSSAPLRLGIMGGTFDPIHNGHLRIAEEMREALGLSKVLFVPAGNPVFKKDQPVTDAKVRLEQVRRAVADNPYFEACDLEVERPGDTFTVDTLRQLRSRYPEGEAELYFILGADAAELLDKWKGAQELAALAHFAVALGRPGSCDEEALRRKLQETAPFQLHFVPVSSLEISSSDIRRRLEEGRSVRYLVPEAAGIPVAEPEPPVPAAVPEGPKVLGKKFWKARRKELKERVDERRFQHSLNVSKTAEELARTYGVDPKKARLAGLLHDWDKGLDDDGIRRRVKELGLEERLDPFVVESMPQVLHGFTAARALAGEFPQIPPDVIQAIERHTVAALDMEPLDMVLYIADAIEPGRQFGSIDELRGLVGKVGLEELFFRTYEYWASLLLERRRMMHPDTIRIWNSYASRVGRKKGTQRQ